ncbi:hypothetical protein AB1E33_07415 [Ruegeria sp. 2012CJ15-1]
MVGIHQVATAIQKESGILKAFENRKIPVLVQRYGARSFLQLAKAKVVAFVVPVCADAELGLVKEIAYARCFFRAYAARKLGEFRQVKVPKVLEQTHIHLKCNAQRSVLAGNLAHAQEPRIGSIIKCRERAIRHAIAATKILGK